MSANQEVVINETGHILNSFITTQDLSFGHDLTLNFDDHQHSHAIIAYRSDPSILAPYPEDSVGIAFYNEGSIRLYPNPAANTLYVENEDSPIEYVIVLDMNGKAILRQDVLEHKAIINVSFLPNGMYFVKTYCNGSFQINKFVKSKF
jgi:hypothetical protein